MLSFKAHLHFFSNMIFINKKDELIGDYYSRPGAGNQ